MAEKTKLKPLIHGFYLYQIFKKRFYYNESKINSLILEVTVKEAAAKKTKDEVKKTT